MRRVTPVIGVIPFTTNWTRGREPYAYSLSFTPAARQTEGAPPLTNLELNMKLRNGILPCLIAILTTLSGLASLAARAQLEQSGAAPAGTLDFSNLPRAGDFG